MKIQEVILAAAIICSYIQIVNTGYDENFIDPTDMENYDQITKSSKSTLKEKESYNIFKGFLQRLLKSAENNGVVIRDEKCGLVDTKMEIKKFLNSDDWDPDSLQIILQNVDFSKDKGVDFWTLLLTCVISCALTWIMDRYYWKGPAHNVEANTPNEQVEETISFSIPDTGQNDVIENIRSESHGVPAAEQDQGDEFSSQSFQMSDKSTQGENQDENRKRQNFISVGTNLADSFSNMQDLPELVSARRDKESTDSTNYQPEVLSSDTEGTSEERVNADTVLDAHHVQYTSMNADCESDFSLINESAPGSLIFEDEASDESV